MDDTILKRSGRNAFLDDEAIPDSNNRLTCLNCTKENCKGNCEKISRTKGRAKNQLRMAR